MNKEKLKRKEVERKVVQFAKSVNWDYNKTLKYVRFELLSYDYKLLKGESCVDKTDYIFSAYKPCKLVVWLSKLFNFKKKALNDEKYK